MNDRPRGERPRDGGSDPRRFAVTGTFEDRDAATKAVRSLAERSVPADIIAVYVLDESGTPRRRVPVEDESGVLRGALIGAVCGALLGVVIVLLTSMGVFVDVTVNPLDSDSIVGAFRVIVSAAVAGLPLGAIIGLGHWQGSKRISVDEAERGSIMVVVSTEELAGTAREVLEDAGARAVSMGHGVTPVIG